MTATTGARVTVRAPWSPRPRATGFLSWETGALVGETGGRGQVPPRATVGALLDALPAVAERVVLVDVPPDVVGWARLPAGGRWRASERGHHLDADAPTLRYADRAGGRAVELRAAAEWGWDGAAPADARDAREALAAALARHVPTLPARPVLGSPSETARLVARHTLPAGRAYPVLDADTRALIAATSPQHRGQLLTTGRTIRGLAVLDGRVMYGALVGGLASGPARRDDVPELPPAGTRGRLRVRFTVPAGWAHVGLFMVPTGGRGYCWPDQPGETAEVWADTLEVERAVAAGWRVDVLERLLLDDDDGRPLDTWARKLRETWRELRADVELPADVRELAAGAVRAMVVTFIGGLAQRAYTVTHLATGLDELPPGVDFTGDDGGYVWRERREPAETTWAHPEWASQVWARGRCRVLHGAGRGPAAAAGLLHVPRAWCVGVRADAVYLDRDPGWPDDGEWGRFRLRGVTDRRRPAPANLDKLTKLGRQVVAEWQRREAVRRG